MGVRHPGQLVYINYWLRFPQQIHCKFKNKQQQNNSPQWVKNSNPFLSCWEVYELIVLCRQIFFCFWNTKVLILACGPSERRVVRGVRGANFIENNYFILLRHFPWRRCRITVTCLILLHSSFQKRDVEIFEMVELFVFQSLFQRTHCVLFLFLLCFTIDTRNASVKLTKASECWVNVEGWELYELLDFSLSNSYNGLCVNAEAYAYEVCMWEWRPEQDAGCLPLSVSVSLPWPLTELEACHCS